MARDTTPETGATANGPSIVRPMEGVGAGYLEANHGSVHVGGSLQ